MGEIKVKWCVYNQRNFFSQKGEKRKHSLKANIFLKEKIKEYILVIVSK